MPLELNGKPWSITDIETLKKYSKEHIFTVSKQFITVNKDPDSDRPIETAPIHLPTSYVMNEFTNGVRKSLGILRYYETHTVANYNGRNVDEYTPLYIAIGHAGVLKSSNLDLNYFLDNAPFNENVKNDSTHENYNSTNATMCRTYSRKNRAEQEIKLQRLCNEITGAILDEKAYPIERLRSLAHSIITQSAGRQMNTKLWDWQTMEDISLRAELVRLANLYTLSMSDIIKMSATDLGDEVLRWKKLGIIEFTHENEWIFNETEKVRKAIMSVPNNSDPVASLIYFLKNNDPYYKIYKPINDRYKYVNNRLQRAKEKTDVKEGEQKEGQLT